MKGNKNLPSLPTYETVVTVVTFATIVTVVTVVTVVTEVTKNCVTKRDTRFYPLFFQGCFFGNAEQTNAVFFSNL